MEVGTYVRVKVAMDLHHVSGTVALSSPLSNSETEKGVEEMDPRQQE